MIFYLSCTGNTRWAAEQLAKITNDKMVFIPDAVKGDCTYHLHDGERIGFCLPVHGWRVQTMVRDFIEKLNLVTMDSRPLREGRGGSPYCYYLITCGDNSGEYTDQLEALLTAKGLNIHSCCCLIMPESYVGLPFMDVDPALREAEKKMNANGILQKFADILVDQRSVRMHIEKGATPRLYSRVLGTFFYKYLITDKRFKVDTDKCISCGKCVKQCHVDNMKMSGGHPEWLHTGRCLTCMACYHHCPEHAIDFWRFTKNKGQYFFNHNKTIKKDAEI